MTRFRLLAGLTALLVAAPAAADKVLVIANHTDAMEMMGQTTPAQDDTYEYWFGDQAVRYDQGDHSVVVSFADKTLYTIDHVKKQYSAIQLPFDFEKLMGPDAAPMMEQMMKMMAATSKVTPLDRTGEFAGHNCKYYKIDISMSMMQSAMDVCISKDLQIDYSKFRELVEAQSELMPNQDWMKDFAQLDGFPIRSETTTTVMGKSFGSWQELQKVEERDAPAGNYGPPSGYQEIKYDPMKQMGHGGRR